MVDAGPWHLVHRALHERPRVVLDGVRTLHGRDPQEVYDELNGARTPGTMEEYAAEFLFLQRLAFSGKAVREVDWTWKPPGFNKAGAYGVPATDKFGEVKPLVGALVRALEKLPPQPRPRGTIKTSPVLPNSALPGSLVYIDPPYKGTTGYGHTLSRDAVVGYAVQYAADKAGVVISEQEPIEELVALGWQTRQIAGDREHGSSFRSNKPEWLTYTFPPHHDAAVRAAL